MRLAWADISDGVFHVTAVEPAAIAHTLARIEPAELLVPDALADDEQIAALVREIGRARHAACRRIKFDSSGGERLLKAQFNVAALDAFGNFSRAEIAAAGAVLGYLELTQKGRLPALLPPRQQVQGHVMAIDAATRRNLELVRDAVGRGSGKLACDHRSDVDVGRRARAGGADSGAADRGGCDRARLDGVDYFFANAPARETTRGCCGGCRIWRARWRGSASGAAVRAIWARSAMRWRSPFGLRDAVSAD